MCGLVFEEVRLQDVSHVIFTPGFMWPGFKLLSGWKDPTMKSYFICVSIWLLSESISGLYLEVKESTEKPTAWASKGLDVPWVIQGL